jgi:hypothetical protein
MKKTQVFFWVGEVLRGPEDLFDEEGPGRPLLVSMKFWLIASSGTRYNISQTCGFLGDLATNDYYSLA